MALCTTDELIALTGTNYTTDILTAIIAESDRTIKTWLSFAGLPLPDADDDLKNASLNLSKAAVYTRMRLDGTRPSSIRIGDLSINEYTEDAITALTDKAREFVQAYIKSHGSQERARYYLRKVNA